MKFKLVAIVESTSTSESYAWNCGTWLEMLCDVKLLARGKDLHWISNDAGGGVSLTELSAFHCRG